MKKLTFIFLMLMLLSSSLVSAQGSPTKELPPTSNIKEIDGYVSLNGQLLKSNEVIYATEENQDELINKFNLSKPTETAKLLSIRVVINSDNTLNESNTNNELIAPFGLFGYRLVQKSVDRVHGSTIIGSGEYHCATWRPAPCTDIKVDVSVNEQVSTEVSTSFGLGFKDIISAEYGYTSGQSVGVSTTVTASAPPIPVGKTYMAAGYAVYNAHFFHFYEKGLFSDTLLGTGTFLEPTNSVIVTDWIK